MSNYQFETVAVPSGSFLGWAAQPGQIITGKVLSYDPAGGQDFSGGRCPQLALELVDAAYSVNKDGQRTDFTAGDMITITAGQANLKRAILAANLNPSDVVRINFARLERTTNGTVKIFDIAVARGSGASHRPAPPVQQYTPAVAPAYPVAPF